MSAPRTDFPPYRWDPTVDGSAGYIGCAFHYGNWKCYVVPCQRYPRMVAEVLA